MKKALKILLPILLVITILVCSVWYLFVYDRELARDILLSFARYNESQGNLELSSQFYDLAYSHSANSTDVAIELAEQYKKSGNFTKAETTLSKAISDGGGKDVYIALCKTYVEQDKLKDAVRLLDNITNEQIKEEISALRPAAPICAPDPGFYNLYISVTLTAENCKIYYGENSTYPSIKNKLYTEPITLKDGENTIYALAIADNGLVSPLNVLGYTVGGIIEKVEFADPAIEGKMREALGVSQEQELYTNDLWTITEFTVPSEAKKYNDLVHLAFVEKLTIENAVGTELGALSGLSNLTSLKITNSSVSADVLASIGALPKLKELTLSNCGLTSISGLSDAAGLVYLDLNNNTIRNISPLSGMTKLETLLLPHNALNDLSAISGLTALKTLNVSSNAIASLAPLGKLTSLVTVNADTNAITDISGLGSLTAMKTLDLQANKLTNVSVLSSCAALEDLNISGNALTDISPLTALTKLLYLNFSNNKVTAIPGFSKNCSLVTINGNSNLISSLAPLSGLQSLNKVYMDYNTEISSVKELASCPRLVEVNVYATKVTSVNSLTDQSIIVNYNPVQ